MRKVLALAVVGGVALSATSAFAGADAFNRKTLGSTWVVVAGGLVINTGEMRGTANTSIGYLKASSTDTAASTVVFTKGTDLAYGAVALGNIATGSNAFVKIQSQDGTGNFTTAAFYTGNNGGGNFFSLAAPVPSPAVLDAWFCGTVAHMRITSAAGVQTYTNDYGTTFGGGGGLGTYGSIALDNYVGFKGSCTTATAATPAAAMPAATDLSLAK